MLMQRKSAFSRRGPDLVTEELVAVLTKKNSFEFKQEADVTEEALLAIIDELNERDDVNGILVQLHLQETPH